MTGWTIADMPTQIGKTAIVTGTGGLGLEVAAGLAAAGAHLIIAGRDARKGEAAVTRLRASSPWAHVEFEELDLADLSSISRFGTRLAHRLDRIDLLVNNAGVMMPPVRRQTIDGFELQLGTNYLGHFAVTSRLLPLLRKAWRARVVTVSSLAARANSKIYFDDLNALGDYDPIVYYGQSKLACLIFALELNRRSQAQEWGITSIAAHPGISRTELFRSGPGPKSSSATVRNLLWFLFQPASQGALPILFASTAAEANGGSYYGPGQLFETRGAPAVAHIPAHALDRLKAQKLWHLSEILTHSCF